MSLIISDERLAKGLAASGWTADREVDIRPWVEAMESAGFAMNRNAKGLLRSLGGLTIRPVGSRKQIYKPHPVHFDPLRIRWDPPLTARERQLGMTLSPLGECFEDSSLYIGEDDSLYASWDILFERLGATLEGSLAVLIFAEKHGDRLTLPGDRAGQ